MILNQKSLSEGNISTIQLLRKQHSQHNELQLHSRDSGSVGSCSNGSTGSTPRSTDNHVRSITDQYKIYQSIGYGQLGQLKAAKHRQTGTYVAVKKVKKYKFKNNLYCSAQKEVAIMKRLQGHPNIIRIHDTFEDRHNIYIVMELCKGGDLFDRMIKKGSYSEYTAAQIITEILKTVQFCHRKGVVHRDVQFESFQLTGKREGMKLRLANFGLAEICQKGEILSEQVGQLQYRAPEIFSQSYDHRADIWSCGVMLYILLCGRVPFEGDNKLETRDNILKREVEFTDEPWDQISLQAKDCIQLMLTKDPAQRPTINQILNHDFLKYSEQLSRKSFEDVLIDRMLHFQRQNKLKRQAVHLISETLSLNQLNQLKQYFNYLDYNRDGKIDAEDLQRAFKQKGSRNINSSDIKELIKAIDIDKDGYINYIEFIAATMNTKLYINESKARSVFQIFDKKHSGFLTQEEICEAIRDYQENDEDIEEVLLEVDKNGDGKIDYKEFMQMMLEETEVECQGPLKRKISW